MEDVYLDTGTAHVAALLVAAGEDGSELQLLRADQLRRIGRSAVMLRGAYQPEESSVPEDGWLNVQTLVGLEVLGETGDRVGALGDAGISQDTLDVEWYELAVPALEKWLGSGGRISPDAVLSCSRELMLVRRGKHADERAPATAPAPGTASH